MFRHLKWTALLFPSGTETMKNVALRAGNWGMGILFGSFCRVYEKKYFLCCLVYHPLRIGSWGVFECPPWGIMRAERRKVNNALLGMALKPVSFLCLLILFSLEGCKATLLMDRHFHTKQTCFMGNVDMVWLELLISRCVCRNVSNA